MSYTRAPATLIAREGYSDYVAVGAAPGETAPTAEKTTSWSDSLVSIGKGLFSVYGESRKGEAYKEIALAQAAAAGKGGTASSGGMPSWVLPVAGVAAVGLVAVVLLRK